MCGRNGPFGTPFSTPKTSPKKLMWVPFLRSSPGNEAHKLFLGGSEWGGIWVGAKKLMLEKFMCFFVPLLLGQCLGTANPYSLSEKYWQYTSNLYRSSPPICNAVPCCILNSGDKETLQYAPNLYCNTPPICTAVRLPFLPAILLRKYQGLGVAESSWLLP